QMLAPPNPFGGMPAPQQMAFPQAQAPQPAPMMPAAPVVAPAPAPAPAVSTAALEEKVARLDGDLTLIKTGVAQLLRIMYSQPGDPDLYQVLTEVCKVRPR